jgi:serine/threonine protein kinase
MLQPTDILQSRYRLIQQLGQNAGRQTWLAEDLSASNLSVIVKLLAFSNQVNWDVLKLFEREAGVLRQLNHPRIPKYRDFFSIDDRTLWFGLVQEYIAGVSLKTALESRERFAIEKIYQIATELLEILTYLHELNPPVLHRDIKPSNLIWGEDQQIYLIDFGAVQEQPSTPGQSFTVVGSYGYTPIEQFGGRAVPASDLYALGATLIHLLTGTCPADLPQQNLKLQWCDRATCPPSFTHWLDKLLEPDSSQRFQTAQEAQQVLETIKEGRSFNPIEATVEQSNVSAIPASGSFYQIKALPGTDIRIEKSPYALTIYKIPDVEGRGCSVLWLNVICLFVIVLAVLSASSIDGYLAFSLFTLGMVGLWLLNRHLTRTSMKIMRFEGNQFTVQHLNQPKETVQPIDTAHIRVTMEAFDDSMEANSYSVIIHSPTKKFQINAGTNLAQARWLEFEIKNWLGR